MVSHKYGEFADMQISDAKKYIRKRIFFLLLVAEDLDKREKFPDVDLLEAHNSTMSRISGFNSLLMCPPELVWVLSLLEEAKKLITDKFNFGRYRKLVLDAGAEVDKICEAPVKEVDTNAEI